MGNRGSPISTGEFARRVNLDGTMDSICLYCFRTVATSHDESTLLLHQAQHICDALEHIRSSDDHPQTTKTEPPPTSD